MKKAALFGVFFLLPNFVICITRTGSTTLDPYEKERSKIQRDLNVVATPHDTLLINWLANERVERKQDVENFAVIRRQDAENFAVMRRQDMEHNAVIRRQDMEHNAVSERQDVENIAVLKKNLNDMKNFALKLFVIPYFCQKFELYGEHWDQEDLVIKDFDPDDLTGISIIKQDLDDRTRASYRANAKKWNRILSGSIHPLAIQFKTSLQKKYPNVSLSILAKDLGLAIALMNNLKHGAVAHLPEAMELLDTDSAIEALSKWDSLSDPIMLNVIYEFEKTTSNRNWKPE